MKKMLTSGGALQIKKKDLYIFEKRWKNGWTIDNFPLFKKMIPQKTNKMMHHTKIKKSDKKNKLSRIKMKVILKDSPRSIGMFLLTLKT